MVAVMHLQQVGRGREREEAGSRKHCLCLHCKLLMATSQASKLRFAKFFFPPRAEAFLFETPAFSVRRRARARARAARNDIRLTVS